jgi:hypothetical protein
VRVAGAVWAESFPAVGEDDPAEIDRTLVIPPGHHPVNVHGTPPPDFIVSDSRALFLVFDGFFLTDVP